MDVREQWEAVDVEFYKELIGLNNDISVGKKEEKEFSQFVLKNKEKFTNPDYLQIFAERVSLTEKYLKENEEMCTIFFTFMKENEDWKQLDFSVRTDLRLGLFEDTFKEFLNQ